MVTASNERTPEAETMQAETMQAETMQAETMQADRLEAGRRKYSGADVDPAMGLRRGRKGKEKEGGALSLLFSLQHCHHCLAIHPPLSISTQTSS